MSSFEIPNFVPEDWVHPEIEIEDYGIVKKYADGTEVVVPSMEGLEHEPQDYETYYPDGSLHFEVGYHFGEITEGPSYYPDGWVPNPKD